MKEISYIMENMKNRKLLISLIVLILGGAIVFGFLFARGFKRKYSLAQLQKMKPKYTDLIYASLSHGGGMNGERYLDSIGYDDNNKIIYTTSESPEHYVPPLVRVYEVEDPDAINKLDALVTEYNMSVWDKVPVSEIEVLDAPSTSLNLRFKPTDGHQYSNYMTINYDLQLPDKCFEVLRNFTDKMISFPAKQIDKYFEGNYEEKIYIGKDIANTEEDIRKVLNGYFRNDTEQGKIQFVDGYEGSIRVRELESGKITDYDTFEIIYEPYKDYDCSWHVRYTGEDEKSYIVTLEYEKMYIEDNEGNVTELIRQ